MNKGMCDTHPLEGDGRGRGALRWCSPFAVGDFVCQLHLFVDENYFALSSVQYN